MVVVGTVVVVVGGGGGLVEVVVAGGRVLVEDVPSGSSGRAGSPGEHPPIASKRTIHAPAIAIVRGAAPVLIPVGRVVVDPPRILGRRSGDPYGPVSAPTTCSRPAARQDRPG